jgi:hypothetical protein
MTHPLILLATLLTGCGEKSPAATAAAAKTGSPVTMPLPSGTAGFVNTLIGSATSDFSPTDSDGATLAYTRLQFRGDGSWAAEGYVEAMDEKMDCAESGTWTAEDASSKTVGTIAWTVNDTSCVGRDQGIQTRAEVTVGTGGIESARFR